MLEVQRGKRPAGTGTLWEEVPRKSQIETGRRPTEVHSGEALWEGSDGSPVENWQAGLT